jgi:predicted DNA-binding protein
MATLAGMPFPGVLMALESFVGSVLMQGPSHILNLLQNPGFSGVPVSAGATPKHHRRSQMPPLHDSKIPSGPKYHFDISERPMRTPYRSILIRLPETTIERLDSLVHELGLPSRASLVRRCINHQLADSEKHELQSALRPPQEHEL